MIFDALRQGAGVVVALAFVSALAWGAIWLMRRFQAQGPGLAGGAAAELRFIRALPLGPRERLVVVEWRGRTLLLGVTAGGVRVLDRDGPPVTEPPLGENPS